MADALGGALLAAYAAAGRLLIPVLPALLGVRARRGREDPARLPERHGRASAPRPDRPVLWVHAASVGETNAVAPLIRRLIEGGHSVLLTTVTVTGAATAARTLPEGTVHQFAPLDVRPSVRRFLQHWRPALALFVESEVWPVIADELAAAGIPHIIVNARMSERSFRWWRFLGRTPRRVFGRITLALAQTEADAGRFAALGLDKIAVLGNLKFDVPPPAAATGAIAALRTAIGGRPFWLAASTHPGEEELVAKAHRLLRAVRPDLVTAIVPRHPQRGPAVAEALAQDGLKVSLRSRGEPLAGGSSILVADTLGELGLFYRVAPVAFIGGSLAQRGGQNPIEPVQLGSAVIHGPNTANFADIYAALGAGAGAAKVRGPEELAAAAQRLLFDDGVRARQNEAARRALVPFTGALDRTMAALRPFLAPLGPDAK